MPDRRTLREKLTALANDPGATDAERHVARQKIARLPADEQRHARDPFFDNNPFVRWEPWAPTGAPMARMITVISRGDGTIEYRVDDRSVTITAAMLLRATTEEIRQHIATALGIPIALVTWL